MSRAADGTQGNGDSFSGRISADGSTVVFVSTASNLVPGDTNGRADVFVKHLVTGAIERVSVNTDGSQRNGDSGLGGVDLSADGRVVAFTSADAPTAAGGNCRFGPQTWGPCADIFVRDRTAQTTTLISRGPVSEASGASDHPRISEDGRFVAFASVALLAAQDGNGVADVYLVDRVTNTMRRISVSTAGRKADGDSLSPEISRDGAVVMFLSSASNLDPSPDPLPCAWTRCQRVYVHDVAGRSTTRVPFAPTTDPVPILGASMDASGRIIAAHVWEGRDRVRGFQRGIVALYDRLLRVHSVVYETYVHLDPKGPAAVIPSTAMALSADGLSIAYATEHATPLAVESTINVLNRVLTEWTPCPTCLPRVLFPGRLFPFDISPHGLVFSPPPPGAPAGPGAQRTDVFVELYDSDRDGMNDEWERAVGLDATSAADATQDPDGDGLTNLDEWKAGSHPRTAFTAYFAEGAANGFFGTAITIANPGPQKAWATVRFIGADGTTTRRLVEVFGRYSTGLGLPKVVDTPGAEFGIVVESDRPLAVKRTMTWAGGGEHVERAIASPAARWLMAEGATHGRFSTFYLLLNPAATAADVTIRYLRPAPAAPVVRTYRVPPNTRRTIAVDLEDPQLAATDVAADISSSVPIVVERAVYLDALDGQGRLGGGTAGAGLAPAARWVIAEGTTGPTFDLFYLLANPASHATPVRVTYLLETGTLTREYTLAPNSRFTIAVDDEAPELAHTAVSAIVESLDGTGIAVERSMWWPGGGPWREGHTTMGSSQTSRRWLADGGASSYSTYASYLIVTNPSGQSAVITLSSGDTTRAPLALAIAARGRLTIDDYPSGFPVLVDSDGPPIVVEQATYQTVNGVVWSHGASALATPVP